MKPASSRQPESELTSLTVNDFQRLSDLIGDIYDAALGLPESDRLDLASRLLASVDGPIADDWEGAWLAELDRREEEAARGGAAATGADWHEVRARVHARLAAR